MYRIVKLKDWQVKAIRIQQMGLCLCKIIIFILLHFNDQLWLANYACTYTVIFFKNFDQPMAHDTHDKHVEAYAVVYCKIC